MVNDSVLKGLLPGDTIKILPLDKIQELSSHERAGWISSMDRFAGSSLTVRKLYSSRDYLRIYVEGQDCWYRGAFIESVDFERFEAAREDKLIELLWGDEGDRNS